MPWPVYYTRKARELLERLRLWGRRRQRHKGRHTRPSPDLYRRLPRESVITPHYRSTTPLWNVLITSRSRPARLEPRMARIRALLRAHLSRWAKRGAHCCRPAARRRSTDCACVPPAIKKWIPGSRTESRTFVAAAAFLSLFLRGETGTAPEDRAVIKVPGVVAVRCSAVRYECSASGGGRDTCGGRLMRSGRC